jgi:hypothetical protein
MEKKQFVKRYLLQMYKTVQFIVATVVKDATKLHCKEKMIMIMIEAN